MQAMHGTDCAAPPATHSLGGDYSSHVFQCRDHVMTAINASGYGAIYLTPNQMVDFSTGEAVISFDMSTLRTSMRDWIDIWVTPFADNLALPLEDWLPDLQGRPRNTIHIRMDTGCQGGTNTIFRAFVVRNGITQELSTDICKSYNQWLTQDAARRDTFELRISRTHIKFGMPDYNQWWVDANVADLGFDRGIFQLGHHSYSPQKDCSNCSANSWHWDNVTISPSISFTMIKADRRYLDNNSQLLTFASPAPTGSFLHFSGTGGFELSWNGGAYSRAVRQPSTGEYHPEHGTSYFVPVPTGASQLRIRFIDDGWYTTDFGMIAKDFSIWSLNATTPTATPSSTLTSSPIPSPSLTASPSPTSSPSPTPSPSPTATPSPSPSPTQTPDTKEPNPCRIQEFVSGRWITRFRGDYVDGLCIDFQLP